MYMHTITHIHKLNVSRKKCVKSSCIVLCLLLFHISFLQCSFKFETKSLSTSCMKIDLKMVGITIY